MLHELPPQEYPVVSAGIDWLTCTGKNSSNALRLERVADNHVRDQRMSGVAVTNQNWLGFEGYKLEGLFFGRREHDVMLCLSGQLAAELGTKAIASSDNVSRLDLQVTIWTMGEVVQIASENWARLKGADKQVGRPRSFSMVIRHPEGQTLYVNSRASDNFGRIYDKGVESKMAPAGLLWRFEVEFKRAVARHESAQLLPQEQLEAYIANRVGLWCSRRSVDHPWAATAKLPEECRFLQVPSRDVLTWFNSSLRVTVAKAVGQYGLKAVLESLGLQKHVQPIGGKVHANLGSKEHLGPSDADSNIA